MKKIIVLLMTAILVLSLAACGGNDNKDNNKLNVNNGNESSKWEHLDWSKGADAADGDVTLRVTSWRQSDQAYYQEIVRRFEEKYDWIKVNLEFTASQGAYYAGIQADILDGNAPDVMDLHRGYMYDYAEEGVLAPQTDFAYMDSYIDVAKDVTVCDEDNYGFMLAYNYFGFIYNEEIFKQVGVEVPKTPEELVAVVKKLSAAGYGGVSYSGATNGAKFGRNIYEICLGAQGINEVLYGIDDGSVTDITAVNGAKEGFETLKYYLDNNIFYNASEGISYEAASSLFAQKKSAILYNGSYYLGEAGDNLELGYFAIPTFSGNSLNASEPAQVACISANSENLGAAKLWVEFLATAEISSYFCTNSKMLSTINGVELNDAVLQKLLNSSESFVIKPTKFKNSEYWELSYEAVFNNVMFQGADWKKEVEILKNKLIDYDLSSL